MFSNSGFGIYFGIINSFVHTVMYYYYYLTSNAGAAPGAPAKKLPWWGKYLTQVQLTQMVIGMVISFTWSYLWLTGHACPLYNMNPWILISFAVVMYASYFYLFLKMYIDKYQKDKAARLARAKEAAAKKETEAVASSSVAPAAAATQRSRTPRRED